MFNKMCVRACVRVIVCVLLNISCLYPTNTTTLNTIPRLKWEEIAQEYFYIHYVMVKIKKKEIKMCWKIFCYNNAKLMVLKKDVCNGTE